MYKALFNTNRTAAEHISTLRKKWLCSKDIIDLLGCKRTTAGNVINEIQKEQINNNEKPTPRYVPREAFLKWQGTTLEDYIEQARIEKEIGGIEWKI